MRALLQTGIASTTFFKKSKQWPRGFWWLGERVDAVLGFFVLEKALARECGLDSSQFSMQAAKWSPPDFVQRKATVMTASLFFGSQQLTSSTPGEGREVRKLDLRASGFLDLVSEAGK